MGFQLYMQEVRSQLECNRTDETSEYVLFTFTEEQVNAELAYFFGCCRRNISPYKALTFFNDHLNEKKPQTAGDKISQLLKTKGGMLIEAELAQENQLNLAMQMGLILKNEKTGKQWIWVESITPKT